MPSEDQPELKSQPGYCTVRENRSKESGKGGEVAFIIRDRIPFQEIRSSDKHLEVQAIEFTAVGHNIKLVNTYIPPSSSCDAGYNKSISKLLELDECIVSDFNAQSPLWHWKLTEDRGNNGASKINLYNHVLLNENARTRVTDSCKSSPDISLASSSIAMSFDWRTEYALGSD